MTSLSVCVLASASFAYVVFLPFGVFALGRLRLDLAPAEMPWALGLLTVGGWAASLWAGRWIEARGAGMQPRLNLLGWCGGLYAGLALLSLGIATALDVAVLCAGLGIITGVQLVLAASLVFDGVPSSARWLWCGAVVVIVSIFGHDPWVVFQRPERVSAVTALAAGVVGWVAWSRQTATMILGWI